MGSFRSNGIVERAFLSVEQQVRVMKDALEHRWVVKLLAARRIVPLLHRCVVGSDGRARSE